MTTLNIRTVRRVDEVAVDKLLQQARVGSSYLTQKPLAILLPDGRFAASFAYQHWQSKPGFEHIDTSKYETPRECIIMISLYIVRHPTKIDIKCGRQAQPVELVATVRFCDDLLPTFRRLCTYTHVEAVVGLRPSFAFPICGKRGRA